MSYIDNFKSYFKSAAALQDILWMIVIVMLVHYTLKMHYLNEMLEKQQNTTEEVGQ